MKIYFYKNIDENWYYKNRKFLVRNVVFGKQEQQLIRNCIKQYGENIFERLLNTAGVKYSSVDVKSLTYTIGDETLNLIDLSSGESVLLYALICELLELKVIFLLILERLDRKHRNIFFRELYHSDIEIIISDYSVLDNDIVDIDEEEVI